MRSQFLVMGMKRFRISLRRSKGVSARSMERPHYWVYHTFCTLSREANKAEGRRRRTFWMYQIGVHACMHVPGRETQLHIPDALSEFVQFLFNGNRLVLPPNQMR